MITTWFAHTSEQSLGEWIVARVAAHAFSRALGPVQMPRMGVLLFFLLTVNYTMMTSNVLIDV